VFYGSGVMFLWAAMLADRPIAVNGSFGNHVAVASDISSGSSQVKHKSKPAKELTSFQSHTFPTHDDPHTSGT